MIELAYMLSWLERPLGSQEVSPGVGVSTSQRVLEEILREGDLWNPLEMGAREESDWICSTKGPVMRNKSGNKTPIVH